MMHTVKDILTKSIQYLERNHISGARRQAEEIISDALGIKRLDLYIQFDRPLNSDEVDRCRKALERRAKFEPAQYIHGLVDFMGCTIKVTPAVLIPRPETEILGEMIVEELKLEDPTIGESTLGGSALLKDKTLWDICTGSGCLGIGIKKRLPDLAVSLSDLSVRALEVAKGNALTNVTPVTCLHGDLFQPFKGKKADYIVCNPPYISESEYQTLSPEVVNFEPKMALVSGRTGFEFYERLAEELPQYLSPGARVWLEIGYNQGDKLKEIFSAPCWTQKVVKKDWSGNDRFFSIFFT